MIILFVSTIVLLLFLLIFILICLNKAKFILKKRPIINIYNEKSNSSFCKYKDFPKYFEEFLLSTEDSQFFKHKGFSIKGILRAIILNFKYKKLIYGGSTITQQLAKNLYLNSSKTFYRKLIEFFIALNIEKNLTKTQILELYINIIYYGNGQYGIYNALKYYFNKEFKNLTMNQSLFLISLISAPSRLNPYTHPEAFLKERKKKLKIITFSQSEKLNLELLKNYNIDILDPELQPKH